MRQKPIGKYIVDFYCSALRLAIEIDGSTHEERILHDEMRQKELENIGIRFLRCTDMDVKRNLEGVCTMIDEWIERNVPGEKDIPH
jgi:very-short-patch-repair endonuclease